MPVLLDSGHDVFFCGKSVAIVTRLGWIDQDDMVLYVVGKHDEAVANTGSDGETTRVVGVELAYGIYPDIYFFGFGLRVRWCSWFGRHCDLGGEDSLEQLLDVSLESFHGDRSILGHIGGDEA